MQQDDAAPAAGPGTAEVHEATAPVKRSDGAMGPPPSRPRSAKAQQQQQQPQQGAVSNSQAAELAAVPQQV